MGDAGVGLGRADTGAGVGMTKHSLGESVKRPVDVFAPVEFWQWRYGQVSAIYCMRGNCRQHDNNDDCTINSRYYEVYEVIWSDGKTERGFLCHGIFKVE